MMSIMYRRAAHHCACADPEWAPPGCPEPGRLAAVLEALRTIARLESELRVHVDG